ncbi:hypothetical protein [Pseudomonas oryzihabitans]|uniref:hypothetical protein n=1 Tax=Pseudomonas oryzihabitans TaxID=47885 RepID=UPI0021B239C7|nr:hypothetical protein [Pseudomonas psychrotolerans]
MPGLESDFREALHYATRNCPARTTGQLAAIDYADRAIRQGLEALTSLERKTLILELGFWLTHYRRLQEFSGQAAGQDQAAADPPQSATPADAKACAPRASRTT